MKTDEGNGIYFGFQPGYGDLLGTHSITFEGTSGKIQHVFTVSPPRKAGIHKVQDGVLYLYGFPSSEVVRLYGYRVEDPDVRMAAWRELTLDYIPLEAGLWDDVSFNKGCYTGQEIIARLESRGRLAKRLVRLTAGEPLAAGSALVAGGKSAGTITSAADGPQGVQALAYVKTAILEQGGTLSAGDITVSLVS